MHANTLFWLGLCLFSISGIGSGFTLPEGLTSTDDFLRRDEDPLLETRDAAELIREHDPLESHIRSAAASAAARSFFRDNSEMFSSPSSRAFNDAMAAYKKRVADVVFKNPEQSRAVETMRPPMRYFDQIKPVETSRNMDQVKYMKAMTTLDQGKNILPIAVPSPLRFHNYRALQPLVSPKYEEEMIPLGRMNGDDSNYEYHYFDDDDDDIYIRNYADNVRPANYRAEELRMIPENEEAFRNTEEEDMMRFAYDSSLEAYLKNSENQMRMEAAKSAAAAAAAARSAAAVAAKTAATRSAVAAAAARSAAAAAAARSAAAAAVAARSAGIRSTSPAAVRSAAAAAAAARSAEAKSVAAAARSAAAAAAA